LNSIDNKIYGQFRSFWMRFQRKERLPDDMLLDTLGATIAIFGMGRVGSGAYDKMRALHGETVVGIDFDAELTKRHQSVGRNVLHGDPSDADFWDKIEQDHSIELVML
ncbi:potassium transporter Kef, partial [Candidatus Endoriftia persephone str. Guaymas]|nr:potassium transporter Kef [Candidatus Endoriftia persephone str. Guaymas]